MIAFRKGHSITAPSGGYPPGAPGAMPPPGPEAMYVYPRNWQAEAKTASDRSACNRWAIGQTGFDPARPVTNDPQWPRRQADFRRAASACLEARGYTVR